MLGIQLISINRKGAKFLKWICCVLLGLFKNKVEGQIIEMYPFKWAVAIISNIYDNWLKLYVCLHNICT